MTALCHPFHGFSMWWVSVMTHVSVIRSRCIVYEAWQINHYCRWTCSVWFAYSRK